MYKKVNVILVSFFLFSFPFKSFSGQWIELDSSWFGSDWYYDSDARKLLGGSVYVLLSEYFDDEQQTKKKNGKIYRFNEIKSFHYVRCYNKTVWTQEVQLWLNGYDTGGWGRLDTFPDIDYGINKVNSPKGDDLYIKFPGALKSSLKKICKIYD